MRQVEFSLNSRPRATRAKWWPLLTPRIISITPSRRSSSTGRWLRTNDLGWACASGRREHCSGCVKAGPPRTASWECQIWGTSRFTSVWKLSALMRWHFQHEPVGICDTHKIAHKSEWASQAKPVKSLALSLRAAYLPPTKIESVNFVRGVSSLSLEAQDERTSQLTQKLTHGFSVWKMYIPNAPASRGSQRTSNSLVVLDIGLESARVAKSSRPLERNAPGRRVQLAAAAQRILCININSYTNTSALISILHWTYVECGATIQCKRALVKTHLALHSLVLALLYGWDG